MDPKGSFLRLWEHSVVTREQRRNTYESDGPELAEHNAEGLVAAEVGRCTPA
jgi:hypothetical protein